MKTLRTILFIVGGILLAVLVMALSFSLLVYKTMPGLTPTTPTEPETTQTQQTTLPDTEPNQTEPTQTDPPTTVETTQEPTTIPTEPYRTIEERALLFIGDSRTVGMASYGPLENADYFSSVGMSVYNAWDTTVSVPQVGDTGLEYLLSVQQYDVIYVMLGINELGYDFNHRLGTYQDLLDRVQAAQPEAVIVVMGNVHVTSSRSETDEYVNNPAINRFNEAISQFADGQTMFYLDSNVLFDDAYGSLSSEHCTDSAHLKADSYSMWNQWVLEETGKLLLNAGL